jgi:PTS system mannose-specific IIA component
MVGLLLLTHNPLGSAFIQAASHVFRGQPERLEAIDVIADQVLDEVHCLANEAVIRLDDGSGVLIMTDIMGGTPANCCQRLSLQTDALQENAFKNVAVIAGISLPMLLRAITYRNEPLDVVVEKALSGGQNGATRL